MGNAICLEWYIDWIEQSNVWQSEWCEEWCIVKETNECSYKGIKDEQCARSRKNEVDVDSNRDIQEQTEYNGFVAAIKAVNKECSE
jgi:hypothetical protein